ncbi:PaaI family thioesterase [Zavarzinia sp. CC-PAN008]|uniref:PaaI family thioesterase n=1 Tax=Zavarzinia sp. CC-PAN008 TaxID=3243332 RepID=UPI003F746C4E
MSLDALRALIAREYPQMDGQVIIESIRPMGALCRLPYHDRHLRAGGTISGPALMTLADAALYYAVLAMIGPVPLAVTTNLNINFLRKPAQKDVLADVRLLKLGRRLAIGEIAMFSEGEDDDLVAHATGTYSIPPDRA